MFLKYPKIHNSYELRFINDYIIKYSTLKHELFVVTEKLHGSNIQIAMDYVNADIDIGTRDKMLGPQENFHGVRDAVEPHMPMIAEIQKQAALNHCTINLYAELIGPGIQKGVQYGTKQLRFFDVAIGSRLIPQCDFINNKNVIIPFEFKVPYLTDDLMSLDTAVEFDTEHNSRISPMEDNEMEGAVIKPYFVTYQDRNDLNKIFYLKKKNKKYQEIEKVDRKLKTPLPSEVLRLNDIFRAFINKNRVESVFSKEGEIKDITQMSQYIKLILADAQEDFLIKNSIPESFTKKEEKAVYNVGSAIATILKTYL